MPDYRTFPQEFAMGILQLKSQLTQREIEIREMRETRRIQTELEAERLRLQQMSIAQQGEIAQADRSARLRIAQMDDQTRQMVVQKQMDFSERRLEDERAGQLNKIADSVSRGEPVFIPDWARAKIPAGALEGPIITTETGEKAPAYKYMRLDSPGLGEWLTPIYSAQLQADYDKTIADRNRLIATEMLTRVKGKTEEARQQAFLNKVEQAKYLDTTEINMWLRTWERIQRTTLQRITNAFLENRSDEAVQIQNDPTWGMNDRDKEEYFDAAAIQEALRRRAQEKLAPGTHSVSGLSPLDHFFKSESIKNMQIPKDEPSSEAQIRKKYGLYNQIEEYGIIDISKGLDQIRFTPTRGSRRSILPTGQGYGSRINYYNQAGAKTGFDYFDEEKVLIKSMGITPNSASITKQIAPPSRTTIPVPLPPEQAGPPTPMVPEQLRAQLESLLQQIEQLPPGSPEAQTIMQQIDALRAAIGAQ